jgi:DNA-binding response OmpR family regulator
VRVLVVESQRPLPLLRRGLQEEGYRVEVAPGGAGADDQGRSVGYDLIVLSLALADDRGLTLLRAWRRGGVRCPILALAAADSVAERVRCYELGADDYLCRPFHPAELRVRARALLRRAYGVADPVVRAHDLEIDTGTRAVRRGGRPIRLTRREYGLLQFLAFHRGKVVSRATIWEHFYDDRDGASSNVVDVFIHSLRRKIDTGADVPLILTRYGEGYLLRADRDA